MEVLAAAVISAIYLFVLEFPFMSRLRNLQSNLTSFCPAV